MFCPQFRPLVGGAERQAEKLSKALARQGLNVAILTPRLEPDSPDSEVDSGVRIHRFPLLDLCKRFPGVPGLGPINLSSIKAQVRSAMLKHLDGVNLVHAHIATPMTAFAMQTAHSRGIPVICKVAMAGDRTDLGEISRIGIGGARLARTMIRELDMWVATTEAVRDSLIEWGVWADRIHKIPNGVEFPSESIEEKPGLARRFLYLGRLSSNIQRDVPTLIRAFDRLAEEFGDIELALIGDGDLFQETATMVSRMRNKDRIRMPGFEDSTPWLKWADCFVLPSRREGLSNALLEAMANGLSCIANDIPPNREVLDDGKAGFLVPVGDESSLLAAMRRLSVEDDLLRTTGSLAFERVKRQYSIESTAVRYTQLYESVSRRRMQA
jgi:glycosyltransferase involved in cell wall biosynthesis